MALNDAVPSSATDVFKRNAEDADRLLNASGSVTNRLGNQILTWEQISQSHAAWNNRGSWVTATAYAVNDVWEDGGVWYVVLSAYTSGATAAADIAGPNIAVLNGNFGSAATKDTGTAQDQIELNSQKTFKSFDSLTSAIAFVTANPSTIERLSTASYRSQAECTTLGISYPDGGGADYVVVAGGTGTADGRSFIDAGSKQLKQTPTFATSFELAAHIKLGANPLIASAAGRDMIYVGRDVKGFTDCHAFTDRTVIKNVTDAGTYGTFDAVTKVQGVHAQSHLFAFQDRTIYDGSGSIGSWGNICWPELTNTGAVGTHYGWWIKDINNTGAGTVATNVGMFIEDLTEASSNSAITLSQSTGFSVYAPNAGKWEMGGNVDINAGLNVSGTSLHSGAMYAGGGFKAGGLANATPPLVGTAITIDKDGNAFQGFADVNSLGVALGVVGDEIIQLIINGATRVAVGDSASGYDLAPTSSTQNLGNPSFLWKELFCVNGTINTSDERLKTFIGVQSEAEKRVAVKLKAALKSFKWNDAIEREDSGGSKARIHFGLGVQTLGQAFESEGLNPNDYAMYCYDEWEDKFDLICTNDGEIEEGVESITRQRIAPEKIPQPNSVELINGKYVSVPQPDKVIDTPVFDTFPIYDTDGNVTESKHQVPVMETVKVPYSRPVKRVYEKKLIAAAGNRYGIRLDQVLAFIVAAI